jgi:hypothetical protein
MASVPWSFVATFFIYKDDSHKLTTKRRYIMTIKDAEVLVSLGYIKKDRSDFENAKTLGIDFNSATWCTDFIAKCIAHGKGLVHASLVIDFLRGAKLGAHGIMTYKRAEFLQGFAVALSQVKLGNINLGKIKHI